MSADETLKAKLTEAITEYHDSHKTRGVKAGLNIQALIADIMKLIADFSGGNTPNPAPPKP